MRLHWKKSLVFAAALLIGASALVQLGCENQDPIAADGTTGGPENPVGNVPPSTYLSLDTSGGQMPDTSASSKVVNWWGEDPDGRVVAYRYRWGQLVMDESVDPPVVTDTLWYDADFQVVATPIWLETNRESISVTLPIRTVYATFLLQVRAVDNDGGVDPGMAEITFPVVNTRPEIAFRLGSNPLQYIGDDYVTYPIRSFVWDATDPDGNESIDKILYAMNPSDGDTNWVELEGSASSVRLGPDELVIGENYFWVKVRDVAGFDSPPISFPDTVNVSTDPDRWLVKEAAGQYLIFDDYRLDSANETLNFYREIYDDLYGPEGEAYSVWELEELPFVTEDLAGTLGLFDNVLWFSSFGQPMLRNAFNAMYNFINTPGKRMLLTTALVDTGMVLDLADSLYSFTGRIGINDDDPVLMVPEAGTGLPQIQLTGGIRQTLYAFQEAEGTEVIYRMDPSTHSTPWYQGEPVVGLRRTDKSYTLIAIPLTNATVNQADVRQVIQVTFE